MREKFRSTAEPARPTIAHEDVISDPGLWVQYVNERVALAKSRQPVWILREIEGTKSSMDLGIVLDYYREGNHQGYIEGDELDGFHVYITEAEEGREPQHLNTEPVGLRSEAQKILEDYLKETSLPPAA